MSNTAPVIAYRHEASHALLGLGTNLALLVTPAASAGIVTDRLTAMMLIASAIGTICAVAGLYVSFYYNLASGGLIVILLTAVFALCWLAAPRPRPGRRPAQTPPARHIRRRKVTGERSDQMRRLPMSSLAA